MARRGLDRERVIAAAAQIADAEGLGALTLARVASELGIRTPSLYNHVAGLDDLRRGVALLGLRELTAAMRSAAVGRAGADALHAVADAYRAYAAQHPGRYAASAVAAPDAGDEEYAAAGAETVELLVAVLAGLGLRGDDAIHGVRAVRSALHGFVSLEAGGGFGLALDRDASYARLVDALSAGLAAPRETAIRARGENHHPR